MHMTMFFSIIYFVLHESLYFQHNPHRYKDWLISKQITSKVNTQNMKKAVQGEDKIKRRFGMVV